MAFIQWSCTRIGWSSRLSRIFVFLFRKPSRKNSDYSKQIQYGGTSWNDRKDTKLCFICRIACTYPTQSFWNIWFETTGRFMVVMLLTGICRVGHHTNSLHTAISVCVITNSLFNWYGKKNLLSGEKKRKKRMCVLEYIRSYKISNLQLFHLFVEKKK